MIDGLKKDIDRALRSYLSDTGKTLGIKKVSPVLHDGIHEYVNRRGKRIRPILFIISFLGYKGRQKYSRERLIRASLSHELLHAFLLAHDDVIDNSPLRRGEPTLHRVFNKKLRARDNDTLGSNLAIVAGDIIYALALEALLSFDAPQKRKEEALLEFTRNTAFTGMGEFIDVINNAAPVEKVENRDIMLTYTLKTARYTFGAPLVTGAALAGADRKETGALSRMGIALGQAFQLQDDLLDLFSTSEKTGKPVLSDLAESKKTLLVRKTYESLKGAGRKTVSGILSKPVRSRSDLLLLKKLIEESGSEAYCRGLISSLVEESRGILSSLKISPKYGKALDEFTSALFHEKEIKTG